MKKILLGFAAATFFASATSSAFAAEKVAIGVPSWTGAQAIAHLISVVVTDRIGGGLRKGGCLQTDNRISGRYNWRDTGRGCAGRRARHYDNAGRFTGAVRGQICTGGYGKYRS